MDVHGLPGSRQNCSTGHHRPRRMATQHLTPRTCFLPWVWCAAKAFLVGKAAEHTDPSSKFCAQTNGNSMSPSTTGGGSTCSSRSTFGGGMRSVDHSATNTWTSAKRNVSLPSRSVKSFAGRATASSRSSSCSTLRSLCKSNTNRRNHECAKGVGAPPLSTTSGKPRIQPNTAKRNDHAEEGSLTNCCHHSNRCTARAASVGTNLSCFHPFGRFYAHVAVDIRGVTSESFASECQQTLVHFVRFSR